jgi:ABC-type transport system involved in Fe-S cluster assembly fused permease/ATPase subunit
MLEVWQRRREHRLFVVVVVAVTGVTVASVFYYLGYRATTVAISHRFATVRKAERVVVLEHGQIIEDGTHEDLITADGRYPELFRLQARYFV